MICITLTRLWPRACGTPKHYDVTDANAVGKRLGRPVHEDVERYLRDPWEDHPSGEALAGMTSGYGAPQDLLDGDLLRRPLATQGARLDERAAAAVVL